MRGPTVKRMGNSLCKYGWNHSLDNQVMYFSLRCGGICGARRNLCYEIHLFQILVYIQLNFLSCISHNALPPQLVTI